MTTVLNLGDWKNHTRMNTNRSIKNKALVCGTSEIILVILNVRCMETLNCMKNWNENFRMRSLLRQHPTTKQWLVF
jgi:hypothetical protein